MNKCTHTIDIMWCIYVYVFCMNNLSTWCVMRWEGRLFVKCVRYVWGKYFGNIFFFGALAFPGCFVWGKSERMATAGRQNATILFW